MGVQGRAINRAHRLGGDLDAMGLGVRHQRKTVSQDIEHVVFGPVVDDDHLKLGVTQLQQ